MKNSVMLITYFLLLFGASVWGSSDLDGSRPLNDVYDYDLYENVLDRELCRRQLRNMRTYEFYDASFRMPQGIYKGNTANLGNYHQCLAIQQTLEDSTAEGKYCMIQTLNQNSFSLPDLAQRSWSGNITWTELENPWSPEMLENYKNAQKSLQNLAAGERVLEGIFIVNAVPLSLALCIPKTCRVEDVLPNIPFINFNYTEQFCRLPDDKPVVGADYAAMVIFSILGCLTVLSTAYELNHVFIKKDPAKPSTLLSTFSVYINTNRLMTISSNPSALDCIDGIRSLSILWVILGHTFIVYLMTYLANPLDFYMWSNELKSAWIMAANVSVDTFLVLSGLLLVYSTANKMNQLKLAKNIHLFYLNRLLRMFPLLATAVLLQASVFHRVSDGASWEIVASQAQECREHWWSTLLHIQNLANPLNYCLPHTWYLSVDVQLHILSPIVLFWVLGSRRTAWSGLTASVISILAVTVIYCFIMDFPGVHDEYYAVYYYRNTMVRAPPFVIGMLFGYILHTSRGKQMKLPTWLVVLGYVLFLIMSGYCIYYVHPGWTSQIWRNFHHSLYRSAWGLSVCWIIFVCVNGYGGPINWFLSLKLWKFVAKISYAMYIYHYPLQFIIAGTGITNNYFSMENIFLLFASDLSYTVVMSIAACILVDAPFSTLQKMLLTAITKPTPKTKGAEAAKGAEDAKGAEAAKGADDAKCVEDANFAEDVKGAKDSTDANGAINKQKTDEEN